MLEFQNISKSFGSKTALHPTSFSIADGEFVSILGPSGCGKTTLLRLIGGLEKADSGTISLAGQDITDLPPHKRSIHTVFQRYALFPHMNVFDNIAYGLRCKKVPEAEIKKKVAEALELANLPGQGHRSVSTLSGGEQQRVALVRALVNTPKLLLLDEPLGALDQKLRLQIQQELVAIQKRVKTTFVFVTHDQQEALTLSDRVVVMESGRIAQAGTPNEIYELPNSYYVANFVGGINTLKGKLTKSADRVSCDVEGVGMILATSPEALKIDAVGGRCGFRHEKASISLKRPSQDPALVNSLEGTVKSLTYLGTHTQYDITLKNGVAVNVFQQNVARSAKRGVTTGDRVFVAWPTALTHIFGDNNEAR